MRSASAAGEHAVSDELRIALVQHAAAEHPDENHARAEQGLREAAAAGARLALLQELYLSRYFCQRQDPALFDTAGPVPGPATARLGALAAELGMVLVTSLFERRAAGLYHNTGVVLDSDGSLAGCYRKMHIPEDPGFHEKFYFTPGDQGFVPIDTSLGRLGVLVCWDQWYPEAARLMALAGAELLLYPTAIGWDPRDPPDEQQRQREAWITVQRGHAVANCLPVLACNRVGLEHDRLAGGAGIQFWGSSFACGPQGEILAMAAEDAAAVIVTDLPLARTERLRRLWPFLRDRRIDAYGGLGARTLVTSPPDLPGG
jgi:N-carbamoylputrescine amidase